ncbi:catalase [Roseivirga ehrenbergii]|uniref:Catalase n=1 Tax=Roseivirga ehrenbergii (strain DSM 102268 / JCM 13514 / KCTC 12282 / NCIMB 14502 / KMM 6017) TaxID=279360 RepID=A0A150X869_ROSEK|nr:catalase [Roseivirga ehrenbergii]KYG74884.1 catalase HPII [Roseivirga ehrenbergii]TCL13777.1 catalase [Roseivirga ehrenbergii]
MAKETKKTPQDESKKQDQLKNYQKDHTGKPLTTNQGMKVNDTNNSLKSGERGSTLLEDFLLREKITSFDHERIPERIVHARGSAAHGVFELYEAIPEYTKAGIFNDTSRKTPVFVRFSTVAGSKGSPDLARDVRGFATKFYTEEGTWDLVGNNMPIFFIQDAMKFPDLIHSVKPEPNNEIPQAASAHDTFYDFVSHTPETLHNHIWVMSDRAIPRSLRMMEGFGIHTFRMINDKGEAHFVKFHWKPILGVHSVTWEEAVKINGADADFHRRDLWDAIEDGQFPEWELGLQIVPEADEHKFDFDLLDPTKLIPEEMVPVKIVGKMTLNKNPENFFAETEQVAFLPGHIVPGLDFTNDPLLQGRLFSYRDTQLSRLGGPNFDQIPINRPVAESHNNQRDGHMQTNVPKGNTAYFPNSMSGGCPHLSKMSEGAFHSYEERIDAKKIRGRSESFNDHFSQPALFYRSLSEWEQAHVADAYTFELGKCNQAHIKSRMLYLINEIDGDLAKKVADGLGMEVPKNIDQPVNQAIGADADVEKHQPRKKKNYLDKSTALSQAETKFDSISTRKVAVLAADGFDHNNYEKMRKALEKKGAKLMIIAPHGGEITCNENKKHAVDAAIATTESVLFDAVYIPGGEKSVKALLKVAKFTKFVNEAFKYCKAVAADNEGEELIDNSAVADHKSDKAVFVNAKPDDFKKAIAQHRNWERMKVAETIAV